MPDADATVNFGDGDDGKNDNNARRPKMQTLRKKLADFEGSKEEEVQRLVLQAKENMRDEVCERKMKQKVY